MPTKKAIKKKPDTTLADTRRAKEFYVGRPFANKLYMAMHLRLEMSFLTKYWNEITK